MFNQSLVAFLSTLTFETENYEAKWSRISKEGFAYKEGFDVYACNCVKFFIPYKVVLKREYYILKNDRITISFQQTNVENGPVVTLDVEVVPVEQRTEVTKKAIELERAIFNKILE